MLNQRLAAAQRVAQELFPAETELDNAILHTSRLAIGVIEGRRAAKLPLNAGQEGLALVSRATTKLIDARSDIIAAHVAFRETQAEIGLRAVSFGDIHESPNNNSQGSLDQPQPYRGPWPIRDHRTQKQVSVDEAAELAKENMGAKASAA